MRAKSPSRKTEAGISRAWLTNIQNQTDIRGRFWMFKWEPDQKQEGATERRNLIACRRIVRWAYTPWTCCQQRGQLASQSPSHWPEQGLWKGKKKKKTSTAICQNNNNRTWKEFAKSKSKKVNQTKHVHWAPRRIKYNALEGRAAHGAPISSDWRGWDCWGGNYRSSPT